MRKFIIAAIGLPLVAAAGFAAVSHAATTVQPKSAGAKSADCCPGEGTSAKPAAADDGCCDGGSCCH